jgi:hypothetical protein
MVRGNNDIKLLLTSSNNSLAVLYYIGNYVTKSGLSSNNAIAYAIKVFNNMGKYSPNIVNKVDRTKKLLSGINNCAANKTEYSGVQVASMVMNHGWDLLLITLHNNPKYLSSI